jgi:hypothetical protein
MTSPADTIPAAIEDGHDRALVALTDEPWRPGEVVVWLSAHLAAVEHVLYPAAKRAGIDAGFLDRQRISTHRLLLSVRTLEHVAAGGPVPRGLPLPVLRDELVDAVVAHAADEHDLLARLVDRLSHDDAAMLLRQYGEALGRGPTRPHPWGPHRGVWERITFAVDAFRDHLLDILDARVVTLPKQRNRRAKKPTKWGHYLLGQPLDGNGETARDG